ncbi:MAG: hypothetical protein GXP27_13515, partial [Planctomycetes bacterium]|nr:hypothetical protein [Planctomycetota bacterium]
IESVGPVYPSQSSQGLAPPKPQLHGTLGRLPDLSELPGVIKRADEMVEPTGVGGKLAEYLLADTWIVDTLETAIELSQGRGRGCRFVTLQGEVLEPDGTLYAGTERVEDAVVSRKTELRRLKRDLEQLDRAIQQEEDRLAALDDSLRQFKQSLEEAESHKSRCQDEYDRLRRDMERAQEEQQQLQAEQETIESRLAELNQQETHLLAQQEQKQMELATAEEDERRLQERIAEQQRELAKLEHREQAWQNACAEEKLKLAKEEERLAGLRESFRRHQSDSNDWHEQSEEAARRWRAGCDKIRKIDLHVLNTAAAMAELYLEKERLSEQVQRFAGQKAALRQRRSQLLAVENQLREQRRHFGEELHAAEIQARDLRHQIQSTRSRIEEEYQIAFEEVLESGASALEDYLAERRNRKSGAGSKSTQASPQQSGGPNSESEFPPPAEDHDGRTGNATEETGFFAPPDSVAHGTDSHDGDAAPAADGTPPEAEQDPGRQDTEQAAADTTDSQPPISEAPVPQVTFEDVREELERRLARLRRKLKMMGSVNTESLHELEELEERYQRLNQQLEDLVEAKATLEEIVRRINAESRKMFLETFESIRKHFQELYRKLFAGGEGDIILEDPNDVLECGIDIVARPPGKELRSISLLSGGEKTLTAIALLLAIFKSRPSPFCVLDEVDAALDESNVDRYAAILKEFKHKTQFLIVTHNKRTMVVADTMYGITMQQSGVSKKMSVRFEDVGEDGEILVNSNSTARTGSGTDSTAA